MIPRDRRPTRFVVLAMFSTMRLKTYNAPPPLGGFRFGRLWASAFGTGVAFSIVYFLVAQGIRERSDTWLSGEAEVLAQVSADTPRDHLYKRIVGEVAELASQEVPDERNARGERLNSVFFLATDPNNSEGPLWVGPSSKDAFVTAIQRAKLVPGAPQIHKSRRATPNVSSRCQGTKRKNRLSRTLRSRG